MDHSTYQKLFEKLPQPYTITSAQLRSAYQSLYNKMLDLFNSSNIRKLNIILQDTEYTAEILKFKIPPLEDKQVEDTLIIDYVKLLYKIITIYPVKYYTTQISAASFLDTFLEIHGNVPGLMLDWKPFYKVIKYYFTSSESLEIYGFLINGTSEQEPGSDGLSNIYCLLLLSLKISKYFPDEYEIEVNGNKVKTNTTEQLVNKFFSRISPNGSYTPIYLKFFAHLCPPHKNRYKLYINELLLLLRGTFDLQCMDSILMLIERLILCNIEDDFSFLIPIITEITTFHVIKQNSESYPYSDILDKYSFFISHTTYVSKRLSEIYMSLFFSPPTREAILERFESLFISFKNICHPSISESRTDRILDFTRYIVPSLKKGLKMISNNKPNKIFYNLRKEMRPTQDDIHRLLSMVCEINILSVRMMDFSALTQPIVIETTIDPLLIDRYFDFAYQCINLIDASGVAYNGWIILTALVLQIDKSEKVRDNFESIFQTAANNIFRDDIAVIISRFFSAVFSKIPFNKENTIKGCENFNFPKLAHLLISNLITLHRNLPSINEKQSTIKPELKGNILFFFSKMVQNCDNDVMQELLPIFTSLPSDSEMYHSVYHLEPVFVSYCLFSNQEQKETVINSFKKELLLPQRSYSRFRFLAIIYSTISITKSKSIEDAKETTDFLHKFTKDEDKKIRKRAWKAISFALQFFKRLHNLKVTLKKDKIKNNPLENAKLDDFEISWGSNPKIAELTMSLFGPVLDKLMTIQDPHEMDDFLKEVGTAVKNSSESIIEFTEGTINNEVCYGLVDSIHEIPQLYKKSVPFKEKIVKCALRIIKDFRERETTIIRTVAICDNLFVWFKYLTITPLNTSMKLMFNLFPSIDHKHPYFNCSYIYTSLITLLNNRKRQIIIPVTDDIRELFTQLVELGTSTYRGIRTSSAILLSDVSDVYPPLFEPIIENLINKASTIPIDLFLDFLTFYSVSNTLTEKDSLLCRTMLILSKNLDFKDNESVNKLKNFMLNICIIQLPFDTPSMNVQEYVDLLNEIEENYLSSKINRTTNLTIMLIIFMCLKHVNDVSAKIFEFIMYNFTHFDIDISAIAEAALSCVLRRRAKMTKERIDVKSFPTIASYPNVLDQVTIKFPENGVYFPIITRNRTDTENLNDEQNENEKEQNINDEQNVNENEQNINDEQNINENDQYINDDQNEADEDEFENYDDVEIDDDEIDAQFEALGTESLNDQPNSNSNSNYIQQQKREIIKVFESFEKIEIEWKINEVTQIYDTELYADMSNGNFIFRDHFYHKTYQFYEDDFLIRSMPGIFSSAANGTSDDKIDSSLPYYYIWENYSKTVGPFCIEKLKEISIKCLSDASHVEVISNVVCDMLKGILNYVLYWKIDDRIKLFKSVILPVVCILSANPNTSTYAELFLMESINHQHSFTIAPLLKVFYEISSGFPNPPIHVRNIISILSSAFTSKPIDFFNSIDQINNKYVTPFIDQIGEYSTSSIGLALCFITTFCEIVSYSNKKSPRYSPEIETKKKDVINIVERMFDLYDNNKGNKNDKKMLAKTLMTSIAYFIPTNYDINFLLVPIYYKHLHTIFEILNSANSQDEESFVSIVSDFMQDLIFSTNTEMEIDFVTLLIKEMMNLALPMQLILLENLNNMIESNIFNIPKSDFNKYEDLLLAYARYEKTMNLGNELRLKIAKILGIFEIRKCTMNCEIINDKNADKLKVDDEVLKAASIILNSFLFDKTDERVKKAFNLIEETVGNKRSKERDFFKSVSEIFIYRHSDHVLPDVEEDITQYRSIVTPDYIC